ncbi:MAG TPA: hypothetical protein VGQ11_08220, partial [Candidatus Acidoferrales bacterium]|nr:hypothetical protein [Candidatus Acidoferrales bacterium]
MRNREPNFESKRMMLPRKICGACRASCALALLVLLPHIAAGQVPQPMQGLNRPRPVNQKYDAASYPVFEFHSGFWINLHHALYEEARIRAQRPTARPLASATVAKKMDGETSADLQAWQESVDFYATSLARRDLLFDGEMVDINNKLAEVET